LGFRLALLSVEWGRLAFQRENITRPLEVSAVADYPCSFCGKLQDQVRKLIEGQGRIFICDQCVASCNEIIEQEFSGMPRPEPKPPRHSWLDRVRRMAVALPR
jgi:hypothetical protein